MKRSVTIPLEEYEQMKSDSFEGQVAQRERDSHERVRKANISLSKKNKSLSVKVTKLEADALELFFLGLVSGVILIGVIIWLAYVLNS